MSVKMEVTYSTLQLVKSHKSADIYISLEHKAVIINATSNYIPIEEFKIIFNDTIPFIKDNNIKKTIFDKRTLKIFHQPSMEWYFTEWKEILFGLGVTKHIKILPDDFVFKSSVKIGRRNIDAEHPKAKYHQTEILYFDTLAEALKG